MNAKSIIPLLLLAGLGGVLAWKGSAIAPQIGLRSSASGGSVAASASSKALAERLTAEKIRKVDLALNGEVVSLEKKGGEWTQPGNWPVVQSEANKLIDVLTTLRTRYVPITIASAESADLKPYGLEASQKPILNQIKASAGTSAVAVTHSLLGEYTFTCDGEIPLLFTENETNKERLYGEPSKTPFVKDSFHHAVINDDYSY